jgi:uncharacterized protein YggE
MKKLLTFILLLFISLNNFAQEYNSLIVEGKAIIKEIPENILITIHLLSSNSDYTVCSDNLTKASNKLQKDLIDLGISSNTIKANKFGVHEDYDYNYQSGERTKKGYQGSIELTIEDKFSSKILSTIMEVMKKTDYKFDYSVEFILSDLQRQNLVNYAIEKSVSDAKQKAEIIAKAADLELIRIKSIKYPNEYSEYNFESDKFNMVQFKAPRLAMVASEDSNSNGMSLNQEEIAIEKTVTIEWITRSK